jgi:hypothetical protein
LQTLIVALQCRADATQHVEKKKEKSVKDDSKVKAKKLKDAPVASPRQSPRLVAAVGVGSLPAVDIGKKRKADATPEAPAAAGSGSKSGSRAGILTELFGFDLLRFKSFEHFI